MFRGSLRVLTTALVLIGILAPAAGAQNRVPCGPHAELAVALERRYDEKPQFVGLTGQGHLIEVFASVRSGSWTIMLTSPQGVSCLIADGESWQPAKPQVAGEPGA
jgi:hypothetical protein